MDYLEALTKIGFTEYEAKIYLALLAENPATGYQISKKSGVPRSMVYEALSRLSARGAVLEAIEERSTLYRPLAPDILISQYEDEYLQIINLLRDGLEKQYQAHPEESIWAVNGTSAALSYAAQMIQKAKKEIYMVLPDEVLEGKLVECIQDACDRGLSIRSVLTGNLSVSCGEIVYHPPVETELHGLADTMIIVVDGFEVLISDFALETKSTITRNRNLVMLSRQFIWMELFTQRLYTQSKPEILDQLLRLEHLLPEDRAILESQSKVREVQK